MKSKGLTLLLAIVALVVAGAGLGKFVELVWRATREAEPALRLDSAAAAAGQGVTLALLGGFRALVADASWVRMYVAWEARDLPATETLLGLVTTLDPRPVYFWLNGARIMAYDFPAWRIETAGGFTAVSPAIQAKFKQQQGEAALQQIDRAMRYHPLSADLWVERANIQLNQLKDLAGAAESYRRAWQQPRAPYFAARLHGELLRRAGRSAEALAWLVKLHPELPTNDEGAGGPVVLGRIRDLERELAVPANNRYQPAR